MSQQRRDLPSWVLPLLLAIPAILMVQRIVMEGWGRPVYKGLMHQTGELAARALVVSLLATPLLKIWPRGAIPRWLRRHRRTFGLAAFGYAFLHAVFYVIWDGTGVFPDMLRVKYILGYAALVIMVPLAWTSRDAAIKALGKRWRVLHRGAYLVAIAGAVHWMLMGSDTAVLIHFGPLALLQLNRLRLVRQARAS